MRVVPASVSRDGRVMTVPNRFVRIFVRAKEHVMPMEPARVNRDGLQPRIAVSKDVLEIAEKTANVIWRQRNVCAIMDTLDYIARERLASMTVAIVRIFCLDFTLTCSSYFAYLRNARTHRWNLQGSSMRVQRRIHEC